jgi:ribA/ribD-fused uncharacterized protein
MTIYFYKVNKPYGCFSNFSRHSFYLKNKYWQTSEHYFQAMKFENTEFEEKIRLSKSPLEAAKLGRNRNFPLRNNWDIIKDDIMKEGVSAKFKANNDIKIILLGTKRKKLIEKTSTDYYWGCGDKGNGKNKLGKILMEIREMLSHEWARGRRK